MVADVGVGGDGGDDFVAHVLRVGSGEADTHIGCGFSHDGEKVGEIHVVAGGVLAAVGVDVLPEQSHLLEASGAQIGHFVENTLHLARAFASAGVGHDAVGAEIVAAAHDAHETAHSVACDSQGDDVAVCLRAAEFDVDCLFACFGGGDEIRQVEVGVGTRHEIYAVVVDKVVFDALRHASDDPHNRAAWAAFAFQRGEELQSAEDFLLGVVAYGASVQEYGVGLFDVVGRGVARHFHHCGHHLAVGHIHLAAVGLNK